jgi:hypothetical protein
MDQLLTKITNTMEPSSSWEANSHSASQKIPRLLWNPKVHCRDQNACHLSMFLARCMKSTPSYPTSRRCYIIIHPSTFRSYEWFFSSDIQTKRFYAFHMFAMCGTCPAHLILLDLNTVIILILITYYEALYYAVISPRPPSLPWIIL